MKRILLLTACVTMFFQLSARVIYVKAGAEGTGTSWENAYGDLQSALRAAKSGDQIWVAAGKYMPTRQNDRSASFQIIDGVELYGGFEGYETSLSLRDFHSNRTILTGEIGSPNSKDDNSYTVVYTHNVSARTIVDGFVISDGMANGYGDNGDIKSSGAGWYNNGEGAVSSPVIRNCIFINNTAREGAGLYNFASNGQCSPKIMNCRFVTNSADFDGGAIYNNGSYGICSPEITKCHFEANAATYGASILNKGVDGEAKPVISESVFIENASIIRGSAIYNYRDGSGVCDAIILACRFEQNNSTINDEISNTTNGSQKNEKSGIVYRPAGH
ncbi:MAG: hypothetical protein JNK77_09595 [Saprospiraceae bacterium]|nr:hypothetical protein [Saprospiraceae bacterium]